MIYSTAHITIIEPNKPDVSYSLAIRHEYATNGLQAAVMRLKKDFGYPIVLEKIAPGFKSAEMELSDGRIIKVEMED